MKKIYYLLIASVAILFAACGENGGSDVDKATYQLSTNLESTYMLSKTGVSSALTATLKKNGTAMSYGKDYYVWCGDNKYATDQITFTKEQIGEQTIVAKDLKGEQLGDAVKITVDGERFYARAYIADATSTLCSRCPNMARAITDFVKATPNRTVVAAYHDNLKYPGKDPVTDETIWSAFPAIDAQYSKLVYGFAIPGLPTAIICLNSDYTQAGAAGSTHVLMKEIFLKWMNKENTKPAGMKMTTSRTGNTIKVAITVKAALAGEYQLGAILVESGIVKPQQDGSKLVTDYVHDHVCRKAITDESKFSEKIGTLKVGDEVTKEYTITLDGSEDWVLSNCSVVAFTGITASASKYAVGMTQSNAIDCKLGESITEYELE